MAKEKVRVLNGKSKGKDATELMVEFREWNPTKEINGKLVSQVNENGQPVMIESFSTRLPILGKMINFALYAKEKSEKSILADFFRILGTNKLPLELTETSFKADNGETVKSINARVVFDDIHQISVKCADQDRGKWNMAIKEYLSNYSADDNIKEYRRNNYECALLLSEYTYDQAKALSKEERAKAIAEIEKKRKAEFDKRAAERAKKEQELEDDLPF